MANNTTQTQNVTRLIAPISYILSGDDDMINVDTSSGGLTTIYLPNITQNGLALNGKTYIINDVSNNASVGNINIVCIGGDTINNFPAIALITDGIAINIIQADRTRYLGTTNVAGGTSLPNLIPITYADLVNFIGAGTLVAGQQYLLTDYETIYDQPDFDALGLPKAVVTTNTGAVEPLILRAVTQFDISGMVQSVVFPLDKIQYDWTFSSTEVMGAPAKGRIIERVSGNYSGGTGNNRASYDHREVVFKRYETFAGSGVYTVINDNGEASDNAILTFAKNKNMYLGGIVDSSSFPFLLSNNIFDLNCYDIIIGADSWNNTFGGGSYGTSFGLSCRNNTIGANFNNNTIGNSFANNTIGDFFENQNIGNSFSGNNIGINSLGNTIGNDFQTNTIGDTFSNNSIGNDFANNGISNSFVSNIIGNLFGENTIDFGFTSNTIGGGFRLNIVGNKVANNNFGVSCQSNKIGNASANNNIGNAFTSNTIGGGFIYNVISGDFNSNITVANFQQNNICRKIIGIDFTLATHVYGNYSCDIVRSSTAVFYLIYFNGLASVPVTPINS
jgi:hypothetical protein